MLSFFSPRPLAVVAALSGLSACATGGVRIDHDPTRIPPYETLSPTGKRMADVAAMARQLTYTYATVRAAESCSPIDPAVLEPRPTYDNIYMGRIPAEAGADFNAVLQFIRSGITLCAVPVLPRSMALGDNVTAITYTPPVEGGHNGSLQVNPAIGAPSQQLFWYAAAITTAIGDTPWGQGFTCRSQYLSQTTPEGEVITGFTAPACYPYTPPRLTVQTAPDTLGQN